jgi:hypothetical protein
MAAENLSVEQAPIGEGQSFSATVVFASEPTRRLEFVWDQTGALYHVRAPGEASVWVGPGGVALGQKLQDVQRANGAPFILTGWGWDYGGRVIDWGEGALSSETCRIFVDFAALGPAPLGDVDWTSDSLAMRNADPFVIAITLVPRSP